MRAASSFLVAVEQQVRPGAGAAYAVAEIATDENDWRAIREFQWTAQATDFSVELGSPPSPGAFRLRIVVRDAQDRQIRVTSQVVDLESFGPSALEAAFGEPDRPESPDALWQRPELVAPDRPGSPDALWQRPELVAPDRPESPDALWQRPELVAPDRPAGH